MTISRPIVGDTALIDRHGQPGGETVETHAPSGTGADTYADWAADAETYVLRRAGQPGPFTFFDALKGAPISVQNPASPKWPGMLAAALHAAGHIDYARDSHGTERWDMSHRPASGGSGVRVWVGTAAKAVLQ